MREGDTMHIRVPFAAALLVLVGWGSSIAQTGGGYGLTWSSIDAGSPTQSAGAGYLLGGTMGQPETGRLAGGAYVMDGGFGPGSLVPTDAPMPDEPDATALVFRLHGNAPNPFESSTAIAFSMAREAAVQLHIYDLAGRLVRTVLQQHLGVGRHQAVWDGNNDAGLPVSKGVYLLYLRAGSFEASRKLVLLR